MEVQALSSYSVTAELGMIVMIYPEGYPPAIFVVVGANDESLEFILERLEPL